ncbi:methionine adenosyltransferase [Polymorphum gilvum]|uniref:S-adenosylmethionine synthetase (Methionine adenosyltransferase) (AdoMet synthetase) (MAT) n=1 Tax=Polymorphum gilvum (strain LMG 25793 / CGMCC 1.9160 / SL003B-26A1) TaxID=991905 RepID=F2IXU6_POLGS|nr:methionine adenosyltransferase [Polymorphum gilvum]ADZ69427.1 S-adenosylmethionine synthetase (Methionine adenosyltransferase) (AdoMet synthetase) (MAT) [Polymorphum gilvum SL003B-26A1]
MRNFIHTSESVTRGHPDKLCDLISDTVVDAFLAAETPAPVNAECALASGIAFLAVRCAGDPKTDLAALVRRSIAEAGYTGPGFNADSCTIMTSVSKDLSFIGHGPGDPLHVQHSATVFGYACRHTAELMPLPIVAAHRLTRALEAARADGRDHLSPDGQSQVAVEFRDRRPARLHNIGLTVAVDGRTQIPARDIEEDLRETVIVPALQGLGTEADAATRVVIRQVPAGGDGLAGHSGLTGRKSANDGYGGYARQSTAGMSGKDPSRIDRTAAYAARHIAKCIVSQGLSDECEVQLSYCAGEDRPISLEIDSFGTGRYPDAEISASVFRHFDLTPAAIATRYRLWQLPGERGGRFYADLATYGHMGRTEIDPPWENTSDIIDLTS